MSEKLTLLDNSSDSEVDFKVNEQYANRYNVWRNKEELQKYKDLKKEDDDSESSSESEEEIPEFDEEFFRALSLVKSKDPRIYDKNFELFKNKEMVKNAKTVKQKPMYMKDYERNLVLKRGGKFSDEEDEQISSNGPTYDEEQEDLKKSLKDVLENSDFENDEDDDLLQVRSKTKKEEEDEEADYLKWLKGEEKDVPQDVKQDMSYLRNYWNDPKLDDREKFLRDYILNKRYLEKDDSEVPTYEEITSGMLSDDEKIIEEQENFEHKYNFRFEEPDEEFIKRYPRTVGDSLRKTDNRRKQKRDDKAERKKREREQRKEELKRLKALKRKEIEEKFSKLKDVCGKEEINLNESDMESDFDPDKHDQKMREMFNEDYYNVEEEQKPEFPYDEELDAENWNAWSGEKIVDEDDENGDEMEPPDIGETVNHNLKHADPKEDFEKEMIEATLPQKRVRKKSLFAKVISQPKPIYDPDGKSYDEYLDEYYKLDYEDVVGDLPVRYKYRKVIPNDFGLSVEEILTADDRELNHWCSVKKTCQYRNDDEEMFDVQAYKKKSQNVFTKKKVLSSLYSPKEPDNEANSDSLSHKSKKKIYLDEATDNPLTSQNVMVNEENDTAHSNSMAVMEKELNQNFSVQNNEYKEKSKKKKLKEKFNIEKHTDDVSVDKSLHLSDVRPAKKKKKYSNEETYNSSSLTHGDAMVSDDMNVAIANLNQAQEEESHPDSFVQNIDSSFVPEISQTLTKKKKKKRKNGTSTNSTHDNAIMSEEMDVTHSNSDQAKEEESNQDSSVQNIDSSCAVPESSQTLTKKKKKKKKKRKNGVSTEVANEAVGHNESKAANKFKRKKHSENTPCDKRLGLSDERLAAYGINPKKFKNRIIYSKK